MQIRDELSKNRALRVHFTKLLCGEEFHAEPK